MSSFNDYLYKRFVLHPHAVMQTLPYFQEVLFSEAIC